MSEELDPYTKAFQQSCTICDGKGYRERIGYSSAAQMDSGADPTLIKQRCYQCHGVGWTYPPATELLQEMSKMAHEIERQKAELLAIKHTTNMERFAATRLVLGLGLLRQHVAVTQHVDLLLNSYRNDIDPAQWQEPNNKKDLA